MKKSFRFAAMSLLALAIIIAPGLTSEGDGDWFDLENCAMCKNLGGEEGLIDHIKWEGHVIPSGMLTIAIVDEGYEAAFARAGEKMKATAAKMQGGEQMHMCGFCMSYGGLMMAGANIQEIESKAGHISVITSTDAAVIAKIQAHARRTIDEQKKWEAQRVAAR